MLVLTAIDYDKKTEILENSKLALEKFFGSGAINTGNFALAGASSVVVKTEPVYATEEVNFTQRGGRGQHVRGGFRGYRGRGRGGRAYQNRNEKNWYG